MGLFFAWLFICYRPFTRKAERTLTRISQTTAAPLLPLQAFKKSDSEFKPYNLI
jgi:hypothetical protein